MTCPSPSRKKSLWWQVTFLVFASWLTATLLFSRGTWHDWTLPQWLEGDPMEVYARVRIASEQPLHALLDFTKINRLGAPVGADWSGYPVPDKAIFVLTGLLSRAVGLFAAIKLVASAVFALNAIAFFLCARWLRWRWEWAAALALVFAYCSYNLRWGVTLSLGQTFTLPPLVLLCARACRRSAAPDNLRGWTILGAALGLWLGQGNPYLAFFAGVIAGGALLLARLKRIPSGRTLPLLIFVVAVTAVFLSTNASYAWHHWYGQHAGLLARPRSDFDLYALRPLDWIVPPADHRVDFVAGVGRAYLTTRLWRGEFFYNYLGVFGLCGLVGLCLTGVRRLRRGRLHGLDAQLGLIWLLVFGVAGGLNSLLGATGIDMFRAATRIGIYATIWSLLHLCGWLSRATAGLPRRVSLLLAAGLACFGCWEETPPLAYSANRERNGVILQAYRELNRTMEQELPSGANVFQLPGVSFPEVGRTGTMNDYEHFLPLLVSAHFNFSYGHLRTSPAARWVSYVTTLAPAAMVAQLEQAGFSALWIDRRAYADLGLSLIATLQRMGVEQIPVPATLPLAVFRLHPAERPTPPDFADPRLNDPWDEPGEAEGKPSLLALSGWYPPERNETAHWRWAQRQADAGIWWNGKQEVIATLRFRSGGQTHSYLNLFLNGEPVWTSPLISGPARFQQMLVSLKPGCNRLHWSLDGPTFFPSNHDPRRLGFRIENLEVSVP